MKILFVHNFYQITGGEESVLRAEVQLLQDHGHEVRTLTEDNKSIQQMSRLDLAGKTLWNSEFAAKTEAEVRKFRPDVVHFHNTFPLISPASYYAVRDAGVPVVQTLHNYRLLCPNALFFRNGQVCEDCLGKSVPLPGVRHRCYRGSRMASAVVASMITYHRFRETWTQEVDRYIVLTEFARNKFIQGGLPADKLVVKPNFVQRKIEAGRGEGGFAFFAGRLSQEKGLGVMLDAWNLPGRTMPLKIAGAGPEEELVREAAARNPLIEFLGLQKPEEVLSLMQNASCLIFPSVWYEGLPMVIIEAYAAGLPVVASNLGGMSSLIQHGKTGLHFEAGSSHDLARQVDLLASSPDLQREMRAGARQEYEAKYTSEKNLKALVGIYESVVRGFSLVLGLVSGWIAF